MLVGIILRSVFEIWEVCSLDQRKLALGEVPEMYIMVEIVGRFRWTEDLDYRYLEVDEANISAE